VRHRPSLSAVSASLLVACLSALPCRLLAQESVTVAPAAAPEAAPESPAAVVPPRAEAQTEQLPVQQLTEPSVQLTLRAPYDVALHTFQQLDGAAAERQCAGDCTVSLAPGRYRFALSAGKRDAVPVRGVFRLEGPDVLEARYVSRRNSRIAGSLLLALTLPASTVGFIRGLTSYAQLDEFCDAFSHCRDEKAGASLKATLILSAVTMAASAALGGWLVSRKDRAQVRLRGRSTGNGMERDAAATPEEPLAREEPRAPSPREPQPTPDLHADDLKRLGVHRNELAQCFSISMAGTVVLEIGIDRAGRLASIKPSREVPGRVWSCLRRTLGRVEFLSGPERSLNLALTP
jgi:hypothetical protein